MALMADAVEAGKVRAVGVSNYTAAQMRVAHAALAERGIPLASNQVQYSLLHRQPEVDGVLDACRELGVTLIAYQPRERRAHRQYVDGTRPTGLRRLQPTFRRPDWKPAAGRLAPPVDRRRVREDPGAGGAAMAPRARRGAAHSGCEECGAGHPQRGCAVVHADPAEIADLDHATTRWRRA